MDTGVQTGGKFVKGHKLGGRPRGSISQATREIAAFCRSVVDSAEYRQRLYDDAVGRKLSPAVEMMLWDRAYGPVPKELKIADVSTLPTNDLLDRMRQILADTPTVDVLPGGEESDTESLCGKE